MWLAWTAAVCMLGAGAAALASFFPSGRILNEAAAQRLDLLAGAALTAAVAAAAVFLVRLLRKYKALAATHAERESLIDRQKLRLDAALANMPQGLCMYDGNRQLIVCNQQYAEMYGLLPEHTKPGTPLRAVLERQLALGNVPNTENYIESRLKSVSAGAPYEMINRLRDGRMVSVVHRPMVGGGWVSTHTDVTERTSREESFRLLFEGNPVPMWLIDRETLRFLAVNDAAVAHYGYSREQFMSMTVLELRPEEDRKRFAEFLRGLDETQFTQNVGQHITRGGELIEVAISSRAMVYAGRKARLTAIHDITKAKTTENELRRTQKFLDAVIEHVPAPILVKDVAGTKGDASGCQYTLVNRAFEELFGIPRTRMVGKTVEEAHPKDCVDFILAGNNLALTSEDPIAVPDHPLDTVRNGTRICTGTTVAVRDDQKSPLYLVTVLQDVTERKRAEGRISRMAHYDHLTDLPNRTTFGDALDASIKSAPGGEGQFTILSIDLDGFKEANDTYGHFVGDGLLCEISRRLQAAAEGAFAARLGGDEFALLVKGDAQAATAIADRVLASIKNEIRVEGHSIKAGATIGAAVYPKDGLDAKTLLSNADIALYRAKTVARGTILFFEADMGEEIRDRRSLQDALRSALERGELFLHYQPQETMSGALLGFEALARWQCPHRGMVPPNVFIPIAEETGLIHAMGEWALREACREAASWPRPLTIAVNVSPLQFRNSDLPNLVHSILLETGLAPSRLELEITEGAFIDDFSRAISILSRLKTLGVRVTLDDFGSGYSSLSYLHSFAFDKIKIDRTFISDLEHNRHSMAIVRAVIDLGLSLSIPVLAEGVETEVQHAMLLGRGCDEIQGYLIGRPATIDAYAGWVGREPVGKSARLIG